MDTVVYKKESVGIKVNNDIYHYVQTQKDLCQGYPLSNIFLSIVTYMLAILIARATEDDHVCGLIPCLMDGGISILHFANDTIIFMEHDLEKALNMKLIYVSLNVGT
jgi:hypothetical protein